MHPQLTIAPVQSFEPQLTFSDLPRRPRDTRRRLPAVRPQQAQDAAHAPAAGVDTPDAITPRFVRSAEKRRLRSMGIVGSALTARSSNMSLSERLLAVTQLASPLEETQER